MLESKEWLQARWFKSSYSCGKYEQGKWRRNNCFPENHQDDLEQRIYPSIYPQTAPLELFGGQLQKPGSTGSFNRGKRVRMCLSTCSEGQQGALLRIMHRRMMKAGDVCYFLLTRWITNVLILLIHLRFSFHFPGEHLKYDLKKKKKKKPAVGTRSTNPILSK